ncbi:MAG: pantetheine-phosphate adenylyltransferase [Bacteroidota bacterium]
MHIESIAVFPGSFDPVTIGHIDLVRRATSLFSHVIVGVGSNSEKKYMFNETQRVAMATTAFADVERVTVKPYTGLTVDFCKLNDARFIIRGIRSASDYEFEKSISVVNHALNPVIETVFLLSDPKHESISSTIVRDIIRNGGDVSGFLPPSVRI